MSSERPWWHGFFDETYARVGFAAGEPQELELERTAEFLMDRLELSPDSLLFDQCCGVGRVSLPLARRGVRIIGVDLSAPYVRRARAAAESEGLPCRYERGDAFDFVAPEPCDAAVCWFTSFGYSDDDELNRRMLANAHASLRPGGRLALERVNAARVLADPSRCHVQHLDGGVTLTVEARLDFERGMHQQTWTFIDPDGRRDAREIETRLYLPHELIAMFRAVGFGDVELLGSVRGEPFDHRSRRMIVLGTSAAERPI